MRTKVEAVRILQEAGWTLAEIELVLGRVPEFDEAVEGPASTPWWSWVGEEWYTGGMPTVADWDALLISKES